MNSPRVISAAVNSQLSTSIEPSTQLKAIRAMRILYITERDEKSQGLGGHWRSLSTLASRMAANGFDVHAGTLSFKENSPVLLDSGIRTRVFSPNRTGLKVIKDFLREKHIDILHFFGHVPFCRLRAKGLTQGLKCVLTKPGGPPLKTRVPTPRDIVVFSGEDLQWFASHGRADQALHHIPNRCTAISCEDRLTHDIRDRSNCDILFVRVCRIGASYARGLRQSGDLVKELQRSGLSTKCAVIGVVESDAVLEQLKNNYGDQLMFFTEARYTRHGARCLAAADFAVGTGRGLMEACSLGIPVLCPAESHKYPVLLDDATFEQAMFFNFSERTKVVGLSECENFRQIRLCVHDCNAFKSASATARCWFHERFDACAADAVYISVYNNASPERATWSDRMAARTYIQQVRIRRYARNFLSSTLIA